MNKSEMIAAIAAKAKITKTDANEALRGFLDTVTEVLKSGGQIVIPGFGTFCVSQRAARMGRNPKTGQPIKISASRTARFKVGKQLKEAVQ